MSYYGETSLEEIANELVGRRIVSLSEERNEMKLDDGTRLIFLDTAECCAWFDVSLEALDFEDNVITKVEHVNHPIDGDYDRFHVSILSNDKQVARLNAEGDASNGYYVHYFDMDVVRVPREGW